MRLTIVIPAYNEEQAIAAIIERTLAARSRIVANSPVTGVDGVVVSDGSTDETVRIARTYSDITLIEFEHTRGYGAAIKRGFAEGSGELVGFLDGQHELATPECTVYRGEARRGNLLKNRHDKSERPPLVTLLLRQIEAIEQILP